MEKVKSEREERAERMRKRHLELLGLEPQGVNFKELAKRITTRIPIKRHNVDETIES